MSLNLNPQSQKSAAKTLLIVILTFVVLLALLFSGEFGSELAIIFIMFVWIGFVLAAAFGVFYVVAEFVRKRHG